MGVTESAPLTPRLITDLDMDHTAMESALPMLRPSPRLLPTMDGAGMAHTAMARGLPMPRLTTEDSATDPTDTESALLMLRLTMDSDTAHTDMERGLPMPRPTTEDSDTALMVMARGQPMLTTDTVDMAPTDMASKCFT